MLITDVKCDTSIIINRTVVFSVYQHHETETHALLLSSVLCDAEYRSRQKHQNQSINKEKAVVLCESHMTHMKTAVK